MFFSDVSVVEISFFLESKGLPLLDDFGDEFGLPHSGELVPVLVVLLTGELSIEFSKVLLLELVVFLKLPLHGDFE
jgi:hypothetical protein